MVWHAAWHATSWVALAAHSLVVATLLFRMTGASGYGVWATIAAFRSAVLFVDAGLAFGVTRDAALYVGGNAASGDRIRASVVLYCAVGAAFALMAFVLRDLPGAMLGLDAVQRTEASVLALAVGLETALSLMGAPLSAALRGLQRFEVLAAGSLIIAVSGIALLLVLTPPLGIVGAGVAVLLARGLGVAGYALWYLRNLPGILRPHLRRETVSSVAMFAAPLWVSAIGSAIGMSTDVPIVGAIFGPTAAGAYGIGAAAPYVGAALLFVLIDTAFPRLATTGRTSLEQLVRILLFGGGFLAVTGFGTLILFRGEILRLWLGASPPLAEAAMTAYAVVWLINLPAHVLAIAAIAKGHHRVIAPIVLFEAMANIVLSLVLAYSIGPIGPAFATVAAVGISNLVIVPVMLTNRTGISLRNLLAPLGAGVVLGLGTALPAWVLASIGQGHVARLTIAVGVAGLAVGAVLLAVVLRRGDVQRVFSIVFDGGWRVLRRESAERREMASRLGAEPGIATGPDPLVTVRIATYDRGSLVAERAIASAIRQTYRNLEILVVGDHCDAATEKAVRSVRDPRVRFVNLPERGMYPEDPMFRWMVAGAKPMNHALEIATGDWIAPLDDDDAFTEDHVEVLLREALTKHLDFVYGVAEMEVAPSRWTRVGSWPLRHGAIVHASVLYSSRLRGFRHSYDSWRLNEPGDWNLWRRMRGAGVRMGFVDRVVCKHYLESRDTRLELA